MEFELVDNAALEKELDEKISEKPPYDGPERRVGQRRCGHDRRSLVRFELDKSDRRQTEDRRNTTNVWDKGHTLF